MLGDGLTGAAILFARIVIAVSSLWAAQDSPPARVAACQEWHECQRLALEAYARGEYERFHDLAWRTVQTGPARNHDLMYLLARAQSLSGRPHDALVMLGRLAAAGFVTDASTDDDFRAVRQLPQWPELEAALTTAARPANSPPSAAPRPPDVPPAAPPANPPPSAAPRLPDASPAARPANIPPSTAPRPPDVPSAARPAALHVEEALRIPGTILGSAGLAYDRVSSRFVVADASLRKLMIIDERSRHLVDLVTSASAGFFDITGLEIDPSRGDLWVVSAEPAETSDDKPAASALHKLQLVSGRPLDRIPIPVDLQPCRLVDVGVTHEGSVLVLDTAGSRLLRFLPVARTFTSVAALHLQSPTSVAVAGDHIVYVAHPAGIARVDTMTRRVESLSSSRGVQLIGFDRIRWVRDSLVGIQHLPDGTRRAVRIRIVDGRAVAMDIFDTDLSATDPPVVTVSDDDFYFAVHEADGDPGDVVIHRSRMR